MLDDLQAMLFGHAPACETLDKGHGRIDRRRYWIKDLSDSGWDGYAGLYGRQQAIRIERERYTCKTAETSIEVSYALTSLTPDQASPRAARGPGPQPLAHQEPPALRARLHLR